MEGYIMAFGNNEYPGSATKGFGSLPAPSRHSQTADDIPEKLHPNPTEKKQKIQKKLPKNFKWRTKKPGHLWDPDN